MTVWHMVPRFFFAWSVHMIKPPFWGLNTYFLVLIWLNYVMPWTIHACQCKLPWPFLTNPSIFLYHITFRSPMESDYIYTVPHYSQQQSSKPFLLQTCLFMHLVDNQFWEFRGRPVRPVCPVVIRVGFVLFWKFCINRLGEGYNFPGL